MKTETKRKILNFIRRLLRYDHTKDAGAFLRIETKRIQLVRSRHEYRVEELKMISPQQVRFATGMAMITELEKHDIIDYEYIPNPVTGYTIVEGRLKIILPTRENKDPNRK